jgi:hypothetical protein
MIDKSVTAQRVEAMYQRVRKLAPGVAGGARRSTKAQIIAALRYGVSPRRIFGSALEQAALSLSNGDEKRFDFRPHRMRTNPTQALPGTPEKIAVLAQRVEAGVELWHPEDPAYLGQLAKRFTRLVCSE